MLSATKDIENLFSHGRAFFIHPIRALLCSSITTTSQAAPKVLFAVPRKRIRGAVVRNTIRRRMRESYRLNWNILPVCESERSIHIGFIYTSSNIYKYQDIQKSMIKILELISKHI